MLRLQYTNVHVCNLGFQIQDNITGQQSPTGLVCRVAGVLCRGFMKFTALDHGSAKPMKTLELHYPMIKFLIDSGLKSTNSFHLQKQLHDVVALVRLSYKETWNH